LRRTSSRPSLYASTVVSRTTRLNSRRGSSRFIGGRAVSVLAEIRSHPALVVANREQRHVEGDDSGQRSRWASVAQQMGDLKPVVRLASVYAVAHHRP
jgi:hypothetical protein